MAPRSMALTSLKWPLYSAIGVLAPFTITISFMIDPPGETRNVECSMLNVECEFRRSLTAPHSTLNIQHSTLNIPRSSCPHCQHRDGKPLYHHQPHAGLDPEPPAGEPFGAAAMDLQHGALRDVAADVVAEDRAGQEVRADVDADGEPEPLVDLVRQGEHPAGQD